MVGAFGSRRRLQLCDDLHRAFRRDVAGLRVHLQPFFLRRCGDIEAEVEAGLQNSVGGIGDAKGDLTLVAGHQHLTTERSYGIKARHSDSQA